MTENRVEIEDREYKYLEKTLLWPTVTWNPALEGKDKAMEAACQKLNALKNLIKSRENIDQKIIAIQAEQKMNFSRLEELIKITRTRQDKFRYRDLLPCLVVALALIIHHANK